MRRQQSRKGRYLKSKGKEEEVRAEQDESKEKECDKETLQRKRKKYIIIQNECRWWINR